MRLELIFKDCQLLKVDFRIAILKTKCDNSAQYYFENVVLLKTLNFAHKMFLDKEASFPDSLLEIAQYSFCSSLSFEIR